MQVSLPWKNKLVTGISAGFVYCGNPKKSKIHCCRRVFVVFWAVAQPTHLLWLHFDFELVGITLDLHNVTRGTRWTQ